MKERNTIAHRNTGHQCTSSVKSNDPKDLNGMNMLLEAIASIDQSITNDHIVSILPSDLTCGTKNTYYNYTSVHGYDLCSMCGKKVALTKDGAVRKHRCIKKEKTYFRHDGVWEIKHLNCE